MLEAEIRQAASPFNAASPTLPTQPEIAPVNGATNNLSIAKDDAELSTAEFAAISSHIADCAQCAAELRQMRAAHRTLRSLPLQSAPGNLRARVRAQLETATQAATATSAIAVAPVRNSASGESLWQRMQRGWNNVWNRPARTAWMGGSLAIGALGIFLLARLPEWSSTQTAQDVVAASNRNNQAANVAQENSATTAPATGNTTITTVPKNAVPKAAKPRPSSAPTKPDSDSGGMTPPTVAPSPAFPSLPSDNAPSSFVAPPLPKLPPVTRIKPKKSDAAKVSNTTQKSTTPNATAVPKATAKAPTNKAPMNKAPTTRADANPTPGAAKADASQNGASSKIATRPEVQRDVISLSVAPLSGANSRVAAGSVGGFMASSPATKSADSADSNADSNSEATPSGAAPAGPPVHSRMVRPNAPTAMQMRKAPAVDTNTSVDNTQTIAQAREVSIEVTPPRDLSKARLLVTLAPDWQFSDAATKATSQNTNDASLQREVWQGSATDGQPLRVTLAIQPLSALNDDSENGALRAGRTPLMVELWDTSGPMRKLVASRRLELPAKNGKTNTEK